VRCVFRVVFDGLARSQHVAHILDVDLPLKHAPKCVDPEDEPSWR
jgi:hypothetical protein